MLKSLKIENFRCFKTFELQQLGRLNLLVGANNSGKTSILEAVRLLCSKAILEALSDIMLHRGEYIWTAEGNGSRELEVCHLFHGHEIETGSGFSISSSENGHERKLVISVCQGDRPDMFENIGLRSLLIQRSGNENTSIEIPLSLKEGLSISLPQIYRNPKELDLNAQYVPTSSLSTKDILALFDRVVLTPEEETVVESLRAIEPNLERIASVGAGKYVSLTAPGGLVVRLSGSAQRIPLGSMGSGMQRILRLALALVNARDGVLLVDEIDTGFHFSAMSDTWKMIWETAKRLNVQVFATTHSSDCWTSLAAIANSEHPSEDGITIQRIERGKSSSIVFTERQIAIAAERDIEVR